MTGPSKGIRFEPVRYREDEARLSASVQCTLWDCAHDPTRGKISRDSRGVELLERSITSRVLRFDYSMAGSFGFITETMVAWSVMPQTLAPYST